MNKRWWLIGIGILAAVWLWQGARPVLPTRESVNRARSGFQSADEAGDADGVGTVRTKAADRDFDATRYTHSPERLREFMLPALAIEGLTLDAALRKLMAAYDDACRKSGEMPLPLSFAIPLGTSRKVSVHLPAGNFKSSVQLLAALSGMKASRKDLEYRFEPMANERKSVKRNLQVPPNFQEALNEMTGVPPSLPFSSQDSPAPKPIRDCLGELVDLDPSTRVSLGPSGELKLETTCSADAALIGDLARTLSEVVPMQLKGEAKIVELPVGSDWAPPDGSQMTDAEIEILMRKSAQTQGAELRTLPSVTSRNGQKATIEIVREVIYPTDESRNEFETRNVGQVLEMQANLLGFGHEVDLNYTDTTGGIDSATGKPSFNKRTEMADRTYTSDGGSKLVVQTRPDGSRAVLLFKSQTIDATGRPIH